LFILDASEFMIGNNKDLFFYIRNYLENFSEKEFLAKDVWIPMFEKKRG